MSNEDLIKKLYRAFKNNDKKTCLHLCHENIEWQLMDGMPNGGKYVGRKQVFENYFPNMLKNFKEFHATPEKFLKFDEHVMVYGRYHGVSNIDKIFDVPFSHVYLIKENQITQFRQFTDTQKIQDCLN